MIKTVAVVSILSAALIATSSAEKKPAAKTKGNTPIVLPADKDFVNKPYSATRIRVLPNGIIELY